MNLYFIYQDINTGYDTFRSAVVVANSAKEAQNIHPDGRSGSYDRYARKSIQSIRGIREIVCGKV